MLEVGKLGASSLAAGKILAVVVNPATTALTLSAVASTAGKYFSKVTWDSRWHAATLWHFSSLGCMKLPPPASQDQPWTVKQESSGDSRSPS